MGDWGTGETKRVEFKLVSYNFLFINAEMKRAVEAGNVDIMVGGNSVDLISPSVNLDKSMILNEMKLDENGD